MVKTIISTLCVIIILLCGALYESSFISRQFLEFDDELQTIYTKIENESAVEEDIYAMQKSWLDKKKYLHIFIPHNEIKEMDLWIAETVKLVKDEKWTDSLSKIEVLKELSEQIPKTFLVRIENIL